MRKIFLICAHQPSKSLSWCVDYLSSFDENTIIIHYDKKSDINQVVSLQKNNVHFIENRVDVTWGEVTQIQATLRLLNFAVKFDFEYCFFLSGDDVPVMSNDKMNKILTRYSGAEFIHYQDERNSYVDPYERCIYRYSNVFFSRKKDVTSKILMKYHRITRAIFYKNHQFIKSMRDGIIPKLFKGTNWFAFTSDTASWLIQTIEKNPAYLKSFDHTFCADEIFFHSLLKTKKGVKLYHDVTKMNDCLRYIDWKSGPQYPKLLNVNDIDLIKNSNTFFCRKVDESMSESDFTKFKELVID
ncbi:beta-1,6-N-acetylglucosaminyltransferase [Rouxiella badensis]|uniref:beta-1,6-N-acetylglucosaminyltransferase n=1 Tax=Rouxiella badensis TaxID=1646377 RepID=UPI0013EF136E|nr:beta-1,6-N-acetylglucosaminyltransferase [Rouxiella badensis]MCC3733302.1 beta-1,6-N-acetylglucosaminyltransferase [Rouxiella badensis]MCC3758047.1 beta-1,6-N-acetylglucosaminyltransferase [Rouxiella badensis]QII36382.1 beta-1,6-N-acetylglucosaminyltransferase [Rouxiella badensis]WAT08726.1 beta-1,6-N-acetylglucosaminyltransferase [Rouxiella badensis]